MSEKLHGAPLERRSLDYRSSERVARRRAAASNFPPGSILSFSSDARTRSAVPRIPSRYTHAEYCVVSVDPRGYLNLVFRNTASPAGKVSPENPSIVRTSRVEVGVANIVRPRRGLPEVSLPKTFDTY